MYNRVYDFLTENTENKILYEKLVFSLHIQEFITCPSRENLFGQSALLMNATYIVFS